MTKEEKDSATAREPVGQRPGSLGRKAAGGAAWSSVGRLGSQGIQFLASLVLARLLVPEDFGLLASVLVFSSFAQLLFEMGMGNALVQLRDLRGADLNTVFWLNALGGVVFAALLAAGGPLLASFFDEPRLTSLAPMVALGFTFNLAVCHLALLQRSLRFRAIALCEVAAATMGYASSITAAAAGLGVYALALGPIVQSVVYSALVWRQTSWWPTGFVTRESARRIWAFSGGLLGFNVVNYWSRNADNLLIGKFVGASALGLYNRAYNLMTLPVQQLAQVLGRVMLPTLASMGEDRARVAHAYRRAIRSLNLLSVPVLVALAAVAPALVPLLWGENWTGAAPLLTILCLAGVPQATATSGGWLYQSQGRTGAMFRVGVVVSILGVLAMVAGLRWGATGVATAVLVRSWLFLPVSLHFAAKTIGLSGWRVIADAVPNWAVCAVMYAVVWSVPVVTGLSREGGLCLLLQVASGSVVFVTLALVVQRDHLRQLLAVLRPTVRKDGI